MSSLLCALDPAAAESRSKKQLGSESRSILGDTSQWMKVSLFYFNLPSKFEVTNVTKGSNLWFLYDEMTIFRCCASY